MTEIILDIYEQHERARSYHNRTLKKMLVAENSIKHSIETPMINNSFNTIHNKDDDNNNNHMQENKDTNFQIYNQQAIENRLF